MLTGGRIFLPCVSPTSRCLVTSANRRTARQGDSSAHRGGFKPSLSEYLEFGRLMGDEPEDVQRQIEANGLDIDIDEESEEILSNWKAERERSARLFDAITQTYGVEQDPTLLRNKNRVHSTPQMNVSETKRYKDRFSFKNDSLQRKLTKNRRRAHGGVPLDVPDTASPSGRAIEETMQTNSRSSVKDSSSSMTSGKQQTPGPATSAFQKALGRREQKVANKTTFFSSKKRGDTSTRALTDAMAERDPVLDEDSESQLPTPKSSTPKLGIRRARCIRKATRSMKSENVEEMVIIQVNSAGAIASNTRFYGFIPLSLMAEAHACRVLAEEKGLLAAGWKPRNNLCEKDSKSKLRRKALSVLKGRRTHVSVIQVDEVNGKVILSERKAKKTLLSKGGALPSPPSYLYEATASLIGEVVCGTVIKCKKDKGILLEFSIPEELLPIDADQTPCHLASQSIDDDWEVRRSPYPPRPPVLVGRLDEGSDLRVGDAVRCVIASVDQENSKVILKRENVS